jgi:hypothetical protein
MAARSMRQTLRKASVWAFSALFGCISLLGSGWHCLVGHEFHGAAACPGHEHAGGAHDYDADDGHAPAATHSDDCPICKFFAQAQWAGEFEPCEFERAVCGAPCPAEQAVFVACIGLYHSRAPPTGSLSC